MKQKIKIIAILVLAFFALLFVFIAEYNCCKSVGYTHEQCVYQMISGD